MSYLKDRIGIAALTCYASLWLGALASLPSWNIVDRLLIAVGVVATTASVLWLYRQARRCGIVQRRGAPTPAEARVASDRRAVATGYSRRVRPGESASVS